MILDNLDMKAIQGENAQELIRQLLNLVEKLSADLWDAQVEIQSLQEEINRLKGEEGKKGNQWTDTVEQNEVLHNTRNQQTT